MIKAQGTEAVDEWKRINENPRAAVPNKQWEWNLDASGGQPAAAPKNNLGGIVKLWAGTARDAEARAKAAEIARNKAQADLANTQAQREKDEASFKATVK